MKHKVCNVRWFCRLSALLVLLMAGASVAIAQTKTVSGTVVDNFGDPVIGANVIIVGTTDGTVTDVDGNFVLHNVKNDAQLKISFIGYEAQTVSVAGQSKLNVALREAGEDLDEVVVIGYGTVKKRDLTGSVASISAESLTKLPVSNVSQALQGKLPGVSVVSQDGRPGADVSIRVRGGGSVTQSNDPLFIVDGFPVSSISDIPSDQIESIDVLKDASSTAIYGARGANGVILITTKGVKDEKVSVTYSGYVQWKTAAKTLDVLNAQDYLKYWWGYTNSYSGQDASSPYFSGFPAYYGLGAAYGNHWNDYANVDIHNYTDDILRTAFTHSHNVNVTGGTEKTKLAFNANFIDDEGIKINSDYRRTNLSLKVQQKIIDNLSADFDVRYSSSRTNGTEGSPSNGTGTLLSSAYMYLPIDNPLGTATYNEVSSGFGNGDVFIDTSKGTPVDFVKDIKQLAYRENLRGTGALTWEIIKGLKLRSELGYSRGHNETDYYAGGIMDGYKSGKVTKSDSETFRSVTTLDYQVQGLGKDHSLGFLFGNEDLKSESNSSVMTGDHYPDNYDYARVIGLLQMYTGNGSFQNTLGIPAKTVSFFGRGNYSYKGRYLLTATFRADGSSKFAPDNRWGFFPAAALAWRVSDESWMASTQDWMDNLKLRLSVGTSGSDNIDASLWQETWQANITNVGGVKTAVFEPVGLLSNPDLKWETTVSRNVGVDFGFLNGRLSGSVDAYWNTTKDLLMRVEVDQTTGYSYQFQNIGKTSNRGVEISLSADVFRNDDWRVNVTATYNYNRNKIDELKDGIVTEYGSGWASNATSPAKDYAFVEGKAVGLIRAYKSLGFYTTSDFTYENGVYTLRDGVADMPTMTPDYGEYSRPSEIQTPAGQSAYPGALKLADEDGDGEADIKEIEVSPRHTGGFSINATYKNFDFTAQFNYVIGGHIYNVGALINMYGNGNSLIGANRLAVVNDCYTYYSVQNGELAVASTPAELDALNRNAKYASNYHFNGIATDDFIEDGSYLRLQNVTLGYTLPKKITKKFGCNRLRAYFTGSNLFCITGYDGLDPEVNTAPSRNSNGSNPGGFPTLGLDYGSYPRARSYTIGLNLEF